MLGDYAGTVRIEALTERTTGGHNEDVAVLAGRRLVLTVEASESDGLKEGLVKTLTGGEQIQASRKHKPVFWYVPTFKLWMATNFVPRVRSDDSGMWRRLLKLPFVNVPEKPDETLRQRLSQPEHLAAVLAWAVKGCLEWQRDGLRPPECVITATDELRTSMDSLARFFEECCVFSKGDTFATAKDLRAAYQAWADREGVPTLRRVGDNRFAAALQQRGCESAEVGHAKEKIWWGVSLNTDAGAADGAGSTLGLSAHMYTREGKVKPASAASALSAFAEVGVRVKARVVPVLSGGWVAYQVVVGDDDRPLDIPPMATREDAAEAARGFGWTVDLTQ